MKKSIVSFAFLTAAHVGFGQVWSTQNSDIWTSGNVGIGYSSAPGLSNLMTLNATSGAGLKIIKGTNTSDAFWVSDNIGSRFSVSSSGIVSIGAAGYRTGILNLALPNGNGSAPAIDLYKSGELNTKFRVYDNGVTMIGNPNSASNGMLSSNGALLSVDGTGANGINLYSNNSTGWAFALHNVDIGGGVFALWKDGGITLGNTGASNVSKLSVNVSSNQQSGIEVYDLTGSSRNFQVTGDGHVKIGNTNAPNISNLNVNVATNQQSAIEVYDIAGAVMNFHVKGDGRVYCREVTVTAAALPFPDYVFDKSYDLKTLSEVDHFIQANHRLPGFESASYYQKNGLATGQLMIKQQEKIEELTLYIIQLEKRLSTLENNK
jgi:hypothetical protein